MSLFVLLAFFCYFTLLLAIGLSAHQTHRSSSDFIMGNRSLNYWLTALSAHASDMSAWIFMSLPGLVFISGIPNIWVAIGLITFMFLNWHYIATRLRIETEKANCYTLSSYFETRYQDTSGLIRITTAIMGLVFMMHYLAAGMIAMGVLFESVFGINYYFGLSLAMGVAVTYTFVGGYVTIAWTDAFQALFLLAVILIVPAVAFFQLPEGTTTIHAAAKLNEIPTGIFASTNFIGVLTSLLTAVGWGLGYFGLPHVLTKFMGIKHPAEIRKSKYFGITWQILTLGASILVGLVGIGFFRGTSIDSQLVFVEMVKILFHPFVAGFILCAIIAANMSTMDSLILVCASIISEDFYKQFVHTKATSSALLKVSRGGVLIVTGIALMIAFSKDSTIYDAVKYAWTGLGCTYGPLVIMSLFYKNANKYGAVAGVIVGGGIAGSWEFFMDPFIPAMIPGFSLGLLTIYLVSRWTSGQRSVFS